MSQKVHNKLPRIVRKLLFFVLLICLPLFQLLRHPLVFFSSGNDPRMVSSDFSRIPITSSRLTEEILQPPREVQFVPFPHNNLGFGNNVQCDWKTPSSPRDAFMLSSSSSKDYSSPDDIQLAALEQSICIPRNETIRSSLHLFSSREAKTCLTKSNITLMVTGDSYNKQLFIGLGDIILNRISNRWYLKFDERMNFVYETEKLMSKQHNVHAVFGCEEECYGKQQPFWQHCGQCIRNFQSTYPNSVIVLGSAIHIFQNQIQTENVDGVIDQYLSLLEHTKKIILNSPPCYQLSKVPRQYRSTNMASQEIYWNWLPYVDKLKTNVRFLDFYQATASCTMNNCSRDGGHRARFVNRWKAQLLLNTICQYQSSSRQSS